MTKTKNNEKLDIDIIGELKKMHRAGVDLSFEVSMNDNGCLFYEGSVHFVVGIYDDDGLDVSYATKSMEFGNHEHPDQVLAEMKEFIGTLNMTTCPNKKKG